MKKMFDHLGQEARFEHLYLVPSTFSPHHKEKRMNNSFIRPIRYLKRLQRCTYSAIITTHALFGEKILIYNVVKLAIFTLIRSRLNELLNIFVANNIIVNKNDQNLAQAR